MRTRMRSGTTLQRCGADTLAMSNPTSYQALFYLLVIKQGIMILLSILVILVPLARRAGIGHVEAHSAPENLVGECCR